MTPLELHQFSRGPCCQGEDTRPALDIRQDQGVIETEIVLVPLLNLDVVKSLMMKVPPDTLLRRRRMASGRGSMPRKAWPKKTRRKKTKVFLIEYFFVFLLSLSYGINYLINPL